MLNTFAQHLSLPNLEVERLLSLNLENLLNEKAVQILLQSLNVSLLQQTLPTAATVLSEKLPPFYGWLKQELGVKRVPDSPDHTTRWVVNFLNNQESLTRLVDLHCSIPSSSLKSATPRLVSLFASVADPEVRQEWQRAIALLCLVIIVGVREGERSLQTI
ncbi:MAG: hypothetical protein HC840_16535 [Leptolyngbyaceae cyanobacterium RM2_2_4]|nr:hypothetical protein [Leptolyngbyaceae cyanobacterium SM1_4_3]NJN90867.1 hypothetical protein [Leptolyngbyaceae cyanobacterium SL_5_14]NJO50783.1 hypothetical protein [Leptolyngbyaceae cyanobacterium RM2_2_4]